MLIPQSLQELRSYAQKSDEAAALSIEAPQYTDEEIKYLSAIRRRLADAKTMRDGNFEQFDGMSYVERCQQNRRLAQTAVKPRANRAEVEFSTGTPRTKLLEQMAHLNNLNLQPDVTAFDEQNFALAELGEAMEDVLEKQGELTNDEERQMLRRYTMFEQGEVFVERTWENQYKNEKKLRGEFKGKFRDVEWGERVRVALGGLKTEVLRNEYVYLGDITKFFMEDVPYAFTRRAISYDKLAPLFSKFEMWKYVEMGMKSFDASSQFTGINSFNPFWLLEAVRKGFCEVIIYQDPCNNEFQLFINGIPMFPIGFPLPWKHGGYNFVKQVSEIIDADFAYGKSLMQRMKMAGAMEDEMWRNVLGMYQQLLKPSMINNTGQVLSSRMFLPGAITNNIPEGKLKPLLEGFRTGLKGEAQVLSIVRENLNETSSNPTFNGQSDGKVPTATQVSIQQAQAEKVFGQAVIVSALLEQKLAYLGIDLILENYFDPIDTKVDEIAGGLRNVYRTSNVMKPIEGRGMGQEVVLTAESDEVPSAYEVYESEKAQEKVSGIPTRIIVLNRDEIQQAKYAFRVKVLPTPKRSTNMQKLMFREEAELFMLSPNFNWGWFEEKSAVTYGENPSKVFNQMQMGVPTAAPGMTPPQDPRLAAAKQLPNRRPGIQAAAMQ